MNRNIQYGLISAVFLFSCSRENKVVESTFPDGSPKKVSVYEGTGEKKELRKETTYYPGKKTQMEGTFKNSQRDGNWVYYYPNGKKWSEGTFREGKSHGKRTTYFENGKVRYIAFYNMEQRVGKWRFYSDKGIFIKEIDYAGVVDTVSK